MLERCDCAGPENGQVRSAREAFEEAIEDSPDGDYDDCACGQVIKPSFTLTRNAEDSLVEEEGAEFCAC